MLPSQPGVVLHWARVLIALSACSTLGMAYGTLTIFADLVVEARRVVHGYTVVYVTRIRIDDFGGLYGIRYSEDCVESILYPSGSRIDYSYSLLPHRVVI